jgi:hypothetical protein
MAPGPPVAPGRQPLPTSPRRPTASKAKPAPRYVRRPARVFLDVGARSVGRVRFGKAQGAVERMIAGRSHRQGGRSERTSALF